MKPGIRHVARLFVTIARLSGMKLSCFGMRLHLPLRFARFFAHVREE
jgi:hypothetical protein